MDPTLISLTQDQILSLHNEEYRHKEVKTYISQNTFLKST